MDLDPNICRKILLLGMEWYVSLIYLLGIFRVRGECSRKGLAIVRL